MFLPSEYALLSLPDPPFLNFLPLRAIHIQTLYPSVPLHAPDNRFPQPPGQYPSDGVVSRALTALESARPNVSGTSMLRSTFLFVVSSIGERLVVSSSVVAGVHSRFPGCQRDSLHEFTVLPPAPPSSRAPHALYPHLDCHQHSQNLPQGPKATNDDFAANSGALPKSFRLHFLDDFSV